MKISYIIFFLLMFSFSVHGKLEYSVGVSPPIVNAGIIQPGESRIIEFALITVSTEPLLVYLDVESGDMDFFSRDAYKGLEYEYSEEGILDWITLFNNPVELSNADDVRFNERIKGKRVVSFLLNVPVDADPGYHVFSIYPNPVTAGTISGQAGAAVVATTAVTILFEVAGDAQRSGAILDTVPQGRTLTTYFKNTGTVTIRTQAFQRVYKDGEFVHEYQSQKALATPGSTVTLTAPTQLENGNYTVATRVTYRTGDVSRNFTLGITSTTALVVAGTTEPVKFPLWIIIIIIIVISLIIYRWVSSER